MSREIEEWRPVVGYEGEYVLTQSLLTKLI